MATDSISDWFHRLTPLNSSSSSINSDFIKIDKNHVSTFAVVHNAETPRKRQLSEGSDSDVTQNRSKKMRGNTQQVHTNVNNDQCTVDMLASMIIDLKSSMNSTVDRIENRISEVEKNMEVRITEKLQNLVEDKVNNEIPKNF